MRIASVIVDIPSRALDSFFDYLLPATEDAYEVGCAVLVDFGHRPVVGYIARIREASEVDNLARLNVVKALLSSPYFNEDAACCAQWIAEEYCARLSEAIHLFLPPGGAPKLQKNDAESSSAAHCELKTPDVGPVDDRWAHLTTEGRSLILPKTAIKQQAIVDALKEGDMRVAELSLELGAVSASIKSLEKRGAVHIEQRRRIRGISPALPADTTASVILSEGQQRALEAVNTALDRGAGSCVLLDGVTGSGKTEVYLRAIRRVLEEGGSAIVLVPEISLTAQTVARFRGRFGQQVAVLHSRLSQGERFDQWDLIRTGSARGAVGARSALFAPMRNLKLIIIDEEHEQSYKQDSSPRYNARDVAFHLVRQKGACLILGSATPSLETLQLCRRRDDCCRIEMPVRVMDRPMPHIDVVDMAKEFNSGQRSMFSKELSEALLRLCELGQKAVVLLNQRGFANFLLCRDCGFVPRCNNCSTSLTYHERGSKGPMLFCHHCDARLSAPVLCPRCASPYLRKFGAGTQRVEDELRALLGPDMPVFRMDADSTSSKGSHERILSDFASADKGVLLGTQMIAKGLDFPDVSLVAVINADTGLNLPDFRAGERSFQLLEQVSGRAGRGEIPGRVIIQSYWPEHPAIQAVLKHDRLAFIEEELSNRQLLGYPPFSRLLNVLFWGDDNACVQAEAERLADVLNRAVESLPAYKDYRVLGPSPCVLSRLKGSYRWHILLKAPLESDIPAFLNAFIKKRKSAPGVNMSVDVDPLSLL